MTYLNLNLDLNHHHDYPVSSYIQAVKQSSFHTKYTLFAQAQKDLPYNFCSKISHASHRVLPNKA